MNMQRRKTLEKLATRLTALREEFDLIAEGIEFERDAEQESLDAMPEGLQDGEAGQAKQAAIEALDEVVTMFTDFDMAEALSKLEEAQA